MNIGSFTPPPPPPLKHHPSTKFGPFSISDTQPLCPGKTSSHNVPRTYATKTEDPCRQFCPHKPFESTIFSSASFSVPVDVECVSHLSVAARRPSHSLSTTYLDHCDSCGCVNPLRIWMLLCPVRVW